MYSEKNKYFLFLLFIIWNIKIYLEYKTIKVLTFANNEDTNVFYRMCLK